MCEKSSNCVNFRNKTSRTAELTSTIENILKVNHVTIAECSSLRGRLLFAEAQRMGRIAGPSVRLLGDIISGRRTHKQLDSATRTTLRWFADRLKFSVPRQVIPDSSMQTVLVFTDAASEGDTHTCGALIFDPQTGLKKFFSIDVEACLITEWRSSGNDQIITHAEAYPIWLAS